MHMLPHSEVFNHCNFIMFDPCQVSFWPSFFCLPMVQRGVFSHPWRLFPCRLLQPVTSFPVSLRRLTCRAKQRRIYHDKNRAKPMDPQAGGHFLTPVGSIRFCQPSNCYWCWNSLMMVNVHPQTLNAKCRTVLDRKRALTCMLSWHVLCHAAEVKCNWHPWNEHDKKIFVLLLKVLSWSFCALLQQLNDSIQNFLCTVIESRNFQSFEFHPLMIPCISSM